MSKAFSHERTSDGKDEWLTPKYITDALGPFDLDPCSPINRPWDTASRYYTQLDDGLIMPWNGRVWLNPPYGNKTSTWMEKIADHGNGIALIFSRTETSTFFPHIWERADSIFFFKGRLSFHHVTGEKGSTAGAPSCLVAYGENNTYAIACSMEKRLLKGVLISLDGCMIVT